MKFPQKALFLLALSLLFVTKASLSDQRPPSELRVTSFEGRNMTIRHRDFQQQALRVGMNMKRYDDVLFVPGDNTSLAKLVALDYSPSDYDGMMVQAGKAPQNSEYIFPCRGSGHLLLSWRPAGTLNERSCWDGVAVSRSGVPIGMTRTTVQKRVNPPLEKAEPTLTALDPETMMIVPGRELTLVRTNDGADGLVVDVIFGAITVQSDQSPSGRSIQAGQRYNYSRDSIEPIDLAEILGSPELQNFLKPDNWQGAGFSDRVQYGINEHLAEASFEAYMITASASRRPLPRPLPTPEPTTEPSPRPTQNPDENVSMENNFFDTFLSQLVPSLVNFAIGQLTDSPQQGPPSTPNPPAIVCSLTGQWLYRAPKDYDYEPAYGFSDIEQPVTITVNLKEEQGELYISSFLKYSVGYGTGQRSGNVIAAILPIQVQVNTTDNLPKFYEGSQNKINSKLAEMSLIFDHVSTVTSGFIGLHSVSTVKSMITPEQIIVIPEQPSTSPIVNTIINGNLTGVISSDQQRIQGNIVFRDETYTNTSTQVPFMMTRQTPCP